MNIKQIEITTPEHVSLQFRVAGLGSRATAQIIDWLIIVLLNLIISLSLITIPKKIFGMDEVSNLVIALIIIISFLLYWGYFTLFEFYSSGRTPGKMLVGLRVIQDNGQTITFLSSIIRNLLRIVDFLPSLYLLGIAMIFFHSKHKRIGDLTAGTIVVYERKGKRGKKAIERDIKRRNITSESIYIDQSAIKNYSIREWQLLNKYVEKLPSLVGKTRFEVTTNIANILLPIANIRIENRPITDLEGDLLALYLILKEEWDYQI